MADGGWRDTPEHSRRIETPLHEWDEEIERFAVQFGFLETKNRENWPERSLTRGAEIRSLMQIYLEDPKNMKWTVWICRSNDRDGNRYWKREFLIRNMAIAEFKDRFWEVLSDGAERLAEWSRRPEILEFAAALQPL